MPDEPRLEEQALSLAAEKVLSSQLDEAEKIDVRTDAGNSSGRGGFSYRRRTGSSNAERHTCKKWNCIQIPLLSIPSVLFWSD